MNTVWHHPIYQGLLFGVELEIEAPGLYDNHEAYSPENDEYYTQEPDLPAGWELREEHSICGPEVVFETPYDYTTSVNQITKLFSDVERQGFRPTRTPRGSTHVHVNVQDLTWEQMASFMMACAWAEPFLIEIAGRGRKGNLFAMSYATAPVGWQGIIRSIRNKREMLYEDTHYMAINFRQMRNHGTVEFRMGPSARTAEEAVNWLRLIETVADAGRNTLITDNPPPFLNYLAGLITSERVLTRVIKQAAAQAAEIWQRLHAKTPVAPTPSPVSNLFPASLTPIPITLDEWANQQIDLLSSEPFQTFTPLLQTLTSGDF